jgi:predicted nucleic acid-binding protein
MTTPAAPPIVLDASAVVALLADAGPTGDWVEMHIRGTSLFAPELMPFEVTNILRRHAAAGLLDATSATLAHADLVALAVDLYPYSALAHRVWELRDNLTAYDGSYVALAELLTASLITLDARLTRATGPQCPIIAYTDDAGR